MQLETILKLKTAGLLSEQNLDLGNVPTGVFTLNKIISGNYTKGIPIGGITQFIGESSTAKTCFATNVLRESQRLGYWSILIDSENAFNRDFATSLGINAEKLIYANPQTVEDCFDTIEKLIKEIRETDTETPIVIAYDSLAVSPIKKEIASENYDSNEMIGALRAKITGAALRKLNSILRSQKVALIIINQIRSKVGLIFGSPDTIASGGKSLEYYLSVNLKTISNKTSDLVKDERDNVVGIKGRVVNTKNKVSRPFQECDFELLYDKGLNPYAGLLKMLEHDGILTKAGTWYTYEGKKFQNGDFLPFLADKSIAAFDGLRLLLNLS